MKIQNKKALQPMLQRRRRDLEIQSAAAVKRRPDAYKGKARSSVAASTRSAKPAYSGTAGLKRHNGSSGPPSKKARYNGCVNWDEDDDELERADDYDSEASSDMEANMFDVDQEEEMSRREAKKEDA